MRTFFASDCIDASFFQDQGCKEKYADGFGYGNGNYYGEGNGRGYATFYGDGWGDGLNYTFEEHKHHEYLIQYWKPI